MSNNDSLHLNLKRDAEYLSVIPISCGFPECLTLHVLCPLCIIVLGWVAPLIKSYRIVSTISSVSRIRQQHQEEIRTPGHRPRRHNDVEEVSECLGDRDKYIHGHILLSAYTSRSVFHHVNG